MSEEPVSGTWFIVATSLPFWRRRTDPAVTYAPLPDGRVLDAVTYRSRGRTRTVLGADTRDDAVPDGWSWRGLTPLTRLTSSRWRVVASGSTGDGPEHAWAVTSFERTVFTPAGVDVYCRAPAMAAPAREAAYAVAGRGDLFEPGRP